MVTFLHRLAAQGTKGLFILPVRLAPCRRWATADLDSQVLTTLQKLLTSYFNLLHPSRGPVKGPFANLPLPLKAKSLDLVRLLLDASAGSDEGKQLVASVERALVGEPDEIRSRWDWGRTRV